MFRLIHDVGVGVVWMGGGTLASPSYLPSHRASPTTYHHITIVTIVLSA